MISRAVPKPVSFAAAQEFGAYSEGGHSAFWMINARSPSEVRWRGALRVST